MNNGPHKSYSHRELSLALYELNMGCYTFAELCGITPTEMMHIMSCESVPRRRDLDKDSEVRRRFQELSGFLWEELFPDTFTARRDRLAEVSTESGPMASVATSILEEYGFVPQGDTTTPFEEAVANDESQKTVSEVLEELLSTLEPREAEILRMRYFDSLSFEQCAEKYHVTRERIRQIEARALRRMRHPTRVQKLSEVCDVSQ